MATYQDGVFPSGSPILTTGAAVTYKCNSFTVSRASDTVPIFDENGAPSGALEFAGFVTGTAEVQYAASTTADPTTAAANATHGVLVNVNIGLANVNCFVQSVVTTKPQRGPWTATLGWQARIN